MVRTGSRESLHRCCNVLYTTPLHIFQLDPWSWSSIERGVTSPWDFSLRLFHCGDHQRINTTWMYTLASLAGISPAQLCLHFRWAAPLVQWSLQSDSLSPSLSYILLNPSIRWCALNPTTQQPPPPRHIISLQASCSPSSAEHHLRKTLHFPAVAAFPTPEWRNFQEWSATCTRRNILTSYRLVVMRRKRF